MDKLDLQISSEFNLYGGVYSSVKREALNHIKLKATENDLVYVGGSTFVVAEII